MTSGKTAVVKICPQCSSARPVTETFCENTVEDASCGFALIQILPTSPKSTETECLVDSAPSVVDELPSDVLACPNGHTVDAGDLLCTTCGADLVPAAEARRDKSEVGEASPNEPESGPDPQPLEITAIDGWQLLSDISTPASVRRRYTAEDASGRRGVLTLYAADGAEPDPEIYEELGRLPLDHIPQIYATGRHDGHAYDVVEFIAEGSLADLDLDPDAEEPLRTIAFEIAKALRDFNRAGLRHRDLRPQAILVRTRDPLDLVIEGFGSAQLSAYDLETVAPLEQTRYMAPEAIAGAVSPASDWWSLGIILLEKLTRGACFEGIGDLAFVIHSMANGVQIPKTIPAEMAVLLQGLMARDFAQRWQWPEFERWYAGHPPQPPVESATTEPETGPGLEIGGIACRRPGTYAVEAARAENWDQAAEHLARGEILTWLEDLGAPSQMRAELRSLDTRTLDNSVRLSIALKYLNSDIPLVHRGQIVSPTWLTQNPEAAQGYFRDDAPDLIDELPRERWLSRLNDRHIAVRERARHHDIALDEVVMEILRLSTSRAALMAQWDERRKKLPDTDDPGLAAIMDRRAPAEEDLVLLLAAEAYQFKSVEDVLTEATVLARNARADHFDQDAAGELILSQPRLELMRTIDELTTNFARCGNPRIDEWVDEFRVRRRMSLPHALVTLSEPPDAWDVPKSQSYVQQVISFFEQKVSYSITRGPLARMTIGKTSEKIDLTELGTPSAPARAILDTILQRGTAAQRVDPEAFIENGLLESRLQRLHRHALLYKRDTGIDGLYLGFPFLVLTPSGTMLKTRIAPILLWPIRIEITAGRRDLQTLRFDAEREEVKLNPALEGVLGPETFANWRKRLSSLLSGGLDMRAVAAEFGRDFPLAADGLSGLPPADFELPRGMGQIACAAVLFHATYMAQSIIEDLRQLKTRPPGESALSAMLRLRAPEEEQSSPSSVAELDRFFTIASDPTQESAILAAREGPGLVIEGPPGTGKSQTIVNLIGDAIGRGQSIAVICQKRAALEVVHKRLAAEGLDSRLILVSDENRDRRPVLEAIRTQIEALAGGRPRNKLAVERASTAARIESIEAEIAEYHDALQTPDHQTGVTYRELLGELIDIESRLEIDQFDDYRLQQALATCERLDVERLGQAVADVVADWLDAEYECSPLCVLKPFGWHKAELVAFVEAFDGFVRADRALSEHAAAKPLRLSCAPDGLHGWLSAYEHKFGDLDPQQRKELLVRARKFLPEAARSISVGDEALQTVRAAKGTLSATDDSGSDPAMRDILEELGAGDLDRFIAYAFRATAEVGFFGRLNPRRWRARRLVRKRLAAGHCGTDEASMRTIRDTALLEKKLRPLRAQLVEVADGLGISAETAQILAADVTGLWKEVDALEQRLAWTRDCVQILLACPAAVAAFQAVASAEAWKAFLGECRTLFDRHALREARNAALDRLEDWIEPEWIATRRHETEVDRSCAEQVTAITASLPTLPAFQKFRARTKDAPDEIFDTLALLRPSAERLRKVRTGSLEEQVRRLFHQQARLAWKSRIEQRSPALLMTQTAREAKLAELGAADCRMRLLNSELLRTSIGHENLGSAQQWAAITKYQGPRALRLREFIRRGVDLGLMALRPIWLMNPDVASRLFPLQEGIFDVVVYDEASQMPVEYALPTLYRGKTVVVSGDEKQLPPTAFFHSKVESDEAEITDGALPDEDTSEEELERLEMSWNRKEIKDCTDLLALGRLSVPRKLLSVHYRSQYRELIEFSNHAFYGGNLDVPARHPDDVVRQVCPIEVHHVDGLYDAQTNLDEANRVVELVAERWARSSCPSIGVVTFNRKQADLIDDLISQRANEDADFAAAYTRETARTENGEDMGFFVKNVENVQGDERDVIIFSTTFGVNKAGAFRRFFGVLGQSGGERRLNVATTRARDKVVIATSMPIGEISDLQIGRSRPSRPRDFLQGYMHYANLISEGRLPEARTMLAAIAGRKSDDLKQEGVIGDGLFEAVGRHIADLGYRADRAHDRSVFGIDFAIKHPDHDLYGIGIECDAPCHPILSTARAREIWRSQVLARAVPHMHRVVSKAWYEHPKSEQDRLARAIEAAIGPPNH